MHKFPIAIDYSFSSLYPRTMMHHTVIDLVKINREITIRNIIEDIDEPLVEDANDFMLKELIKERQKHKLNQKTWTTII